MGSESPIELYDGSNVLYNQVTSYATSGTNLYWEGTRFFDCSDDGLQLVDNETTAAALMYGFAYEPTDACQGLSNITIMVDELSTPEITGGKLVVKYFATTDMHYFTELEEGVPFTAIRDDEGITIIAVCQYYNLEKVSISTLGAAWDFQVVFSAGDVEIAELEGKNVLETDFEAGIFLPLDYENIVGPWDIFEFGEYPQTLKAKHVTITSDTPDEDGYYLGSDGARYAKHTIGLSSVYTFNSMSADEYAALGYLTAKDGTQMLEGETYYFKVEPIKWRVAKTENDQLFVVANKILKGIEYQSDSDYVEGDEKYYTTANGAPDGTYANNYEYSDLRAFLTGEFYDQAFSEAEKSKILTTTVDNSVNSSGSNSDGENPYACRDTQDKVFAISKADYQNKEYDFSLNHSGGSGPRAWTATDYAKATGVMTITAQYIETEVAEEEKAVYNEYIGIGSMWSRSPCFDSSVHALGCGMHEEFISSVYLAIYEPTVGAVLAMNIEWASP